MNWRILLLCFLSQNLAIGGAYGSFGPLLADSETHFGVSRTLAVLGLSVVALASSGLAPFLGGMLERAPLRKAMMVSAILSSAGYVLLATVNDFRIALVGYALTGVGICVLGLLAPVTLAGRAFSAEHRGRLLGLVYIPVLQLAVPFLVGLSLAQAGRSGVLMTIAAAFLGLAALIWIVLRREPPLPGGQSAADAGGGSVVAVKEVTTTRSILRVPAFWLLSLGIGMLSGASSALMVHIVPYAMSLDMSFLEASSLLSAFAGAGMLGTFLFGWLADRTSGTIALSVSAIVQAVMWFSILQLGGTWLFVPVALVGFCIAPVVILHGAAIGQIFGFGSVSRIIGLGYAIKLPFLFGVAPLLALGFEATGSYTIPFLAMAGALAMAASFFLVLTRNHPRASAAG